MIIAITCSMLEYSSTSYDYYIGHGVSKSASLEPTINNSMKQTRQ